MTERPRRRIDGEREDTEKDCYDFSERVKRSKGYENVKLTDGYILKRLMVPGGWIVRCYKNTGVSICFYPDKYHRWQPGNDPVWIEEGEILQEPKLQRPKIENKKSVYTFDDSNIHYISTKFPGRIVLEEPMILSIKDVVTIKGRLCEVVDIISGTTFVVRGI